MGIFSIETPVDKSEFDEAKRQEDDYKGKVEGFDQEPTVSDSEAEWDIDMSGAISSIAKDMETTSKRINNISVAITTVNDNHDELQKSLSFTAPEVTGYTDSNSQSNSDSDNDCKNCNSQGSFDDYSGFGTGFGGGATSSSGCDDCDKDSEDDDLDEFDDLEDFDENEDEDEDEEEKTKEPGSIDTELTLTSIGYIPFSNLNANIEDYDDVVKTDYNSWKTNIVMDFDENGYARLYPPEEARDEEVDIIGEENRYVVACNSSVGSVGDVLRFTQENGDIIECVIGYHNDEDTSFSNKDTLYFIVDDEGFEKNDMYESLINNNSSYEHIVDTSYEKVENKSHIADKNEEGSVLV